MNRILAWNYHNRKSWPFNQFPDKQIHRPRTLGMKGSPGPFEEGTHHTITTFILWIFLAFSNWNCRPFSWMTVHCCMCAQMLQSCPTLCNSVDCSLPGSSVHGILQAERIFRMLKWAAMPSSRGSLQPGTEPVSSVSCIGRWVLHHSRHLASPIQSVFTYNFVINK